MSIHDLIQDCLFRGDLYLLEPWDPNTERKRTIFVSLTVKDFIDSPKPRAGQLHADLDRFIGGGPLTAAMVPRKATDEYFGLLKPAADGFWDIRSQAPSPSLRLLGGFTERDVFVGLVLRERKLLGSALSQEWSNAIRECKTEWDRRFHAYTPLRGGRLHDYISNCTSVV